MQNITSDKNPIHHIRHAEIKIEDVSKKLYHKIVDWIQKHPILTLVLSFSVSVVSNLVSQWLWDFFKF